MFNATANRTATANRFAELADMLHGETLSIYRDLAAVDPANIGRTDLRAIGDRISRINRNREACDNVARKLRLKSTGKRRPAAPRTVRR